MTLPGVGRKTANVVLGNAFGIPGITVDTHFGRLARRFGWTDETDPVKVEHAVGALFPKRDWTMLSHHLIWHGRRRLPRQEARLRRLPGRAAGARRTARARPTRSRRRSWCRPRAGHEARRSRRRAARPLLGRSPAAPAAATPRRGARARPRSTSTPPSCAALKAQAGIADCVPGARRPGRRRAARRHPALPRRRPRRRPGRACAGPMVVNLWAVLVRPVPQGDAGPRRRSTRSTATGCRCSASTSRTPSPSGALGAGRGRPASTYPLLADPRRRPRRRDAVRRAPRAAVPRRFVDADGAVVHQRVRGRRVARPQLDDLVDEHLGVDPVSRPARCPTGCEPVARAAPSRSPPTT